MIQLQIKNSDYEHYAVYKCVQNTIIIYYILYLKL